MAGMMEVKVRLKDCFFDAPKVMAAVDKARHRNLNWAGGRIRLIASRSMRDRDDIKVSSPPGKPPFAHGNPQLKKGAFGVQYGYDESTDSVIAGAVPFSGKSDVPHILEFGGVTKPAFWMRNKIGKITIRARPYMAPALEVWQDKYAALWRGSVTGP